MFILPVLLYIECPTNSLNLLLNIFRGEIVVVCFFLVSRHSL